MNPVLEMISTGSELLSGRTLNTHAQSLARPIWSLWGGDWFVIPPCLMTCYP